MMRMALVGHSHPCAILGQGESGYSEEDIVLYIETVCDTCVKVLDPRSCIRRDSDPMILPVADRV